MDFDNVKRTVDEFTKRLQIPNSDFSVTENGGEDSCELTVLIDNQIILNLSISSGIIKVVYTNDYESLDYEAQEFDCTVDLIYYLTVFVFSVLLKNSSEEVEYTFNDFLSLVLSSTITDWKSLVEALCVNLGILCSVEDDFVMIGDMTMVYNPFTHEASLDDMVFPLDGNNYIQVVKGIFLIVSYIAVLMQKDGSMFEIDKNIENLKEADEAIENGDTDFDMDVDMDFDMDMGNNDMGPEPPVEIQEEPEEEEDMGLEEEL